MSAAGVAYEERLLAWLPEGRHEGENIHHARARFHTAEYLESMKALRVHYGIPEPTPPPAPPVPLVDDGIDDLVWARKNPDRRYRVRPWRPEDAEPQARPGHCITVVDVIRKTGAHGVPIDAMWRAGMTVKIEDSDQYAEIFLKANYATGCFRKPLPEIAK